jgi:glyoxylase-like metal-dependent hydrolase (beta-lactamase superfamily II)
MKKNIFSFSLFVSLVVFSQASNSQESDGETPRLEQISESVFRSVHRPGAANSNVIVTDEGLIVFDGTCRGAGDPAWLKQELGRLYDVPVKYVILSHDHEDHICDLHVFDDTAVTISHALTRQHIVREGRNTSIPDIVFDQEMEIHLGGKKIVLYYFGPTHTNNLIQVHFPEEGVLMAPDIARAERSLAMPDFRDADIDNLIETLGVLAKLDDVEIVIPGHWGVTNQESFLEYRDYVIALKDRVLEEMIAGATIEQILERVTMEDFSDYGNIDIWLRPNIISMWDKMYRYREPNRDGPGGEDSGGVYQDAYPLGFSVGDSGAGSNQ